MVEGVIGAVQDPRLPGRVVGEQSVGAIGKVTV